MNIFNNKKLFVNFFSIIFFIIYFIFFSRIYFYSSIIIPFSINPYDICIKYPIFWKFFKIYSLFINLISFYLIFNYIYINFIYIKNSSTKNFTNKISDSELKLLIGLDTENNKIYLNESSLYQNILITGTIGSGKTSSAIYPFLEQLISYENKNIEKKLGMLILDVKGNMFYQIKKFAQKYNRQNDLIVISLNSGEKYNPLHKPNLTPIVLANRLKTILNLFSPNNSESYWLDKVEQILTESIKLCRIYNNGYVTFEEIHNLVTSYDYFKNKLHIIKKLFQSGRLKERQVYDVLSSLKFLDKEYFSMDERTFSILKSEITRITNIFVSDYDVLNTFSSSKNDLSFKNFNDVFNNGKIVVLQMNIFEYKNLSKIIAAYLKLDFQTEVMTRLKYTNNLRPVCFISDEFHEYVTSTDADFFAQSREAKCINIVATQSYSSLLNTLNNETSLKVIVQNLINKLWYRTDDIYTIESVQKQIGKEDKKKILKSVSENSNETNYNYFLNSFTSKKSNISESISTQIQYDFIYDSNYFTQNLETFSCLSFLSNGINILPPKKLYMVPYFKKNNYMK